MKCERNLKLKGIRCLVVLVVAGILISAAAGTWLRRPVRRLAITLPPEGSIPDIIYLVAGARAQPRRLEALAQYAIGIADLSLDGHRLPEIWIGNDFETGPWSGEMQRNLTRAEWARKLLRDRLGPTRADRYPIIIVPGRAWGTDAEMAALSRALAEKLPSAGVSGDSLHLALVTCSSHARRVIGRLRAHAAFPLTMSAVSAADSWTEWLPWISLAEWIKIARDRAGWASAPWISRQWYQGHESEILDWVGGWILIGLLFIVGPVYAWLVFPPVLALVARMKNPAQWDAGVTSERSPRDDIDTLVLIAAHNEAEVIESRLLNLGNQVASGCRFAVVVGVDGATDTTEREARSGATRLMSLGIPAHIHIDAVRRGKVATLKRLIQWAMKEYPQAQKLVFSDANTRFADDALSQLLHPLGDARVGGVCGRLVLTGPVPESNKRSLPSAHNLESRYWQWENRLKAWESRLDSCLGANGAIYAVRSDLFPVDLPDNTIVDDLVIGMAVREQGFRMVYQPAAVAFETLPPTDAEWRRRVRIGAGDFQAMSICRRCLLPRYGWFAWCFWSHKVLRWMTPHLIVGAWLIAGAEWLRHGMRNPWWPIIAAFVAGVPLVVLIAKTVFRRKGLDYWITMQAALLVGSLQGLRGGLQGYWERTPR